MIWKVTLLDNTEIFEYKDGIESFLKDIDFNQIKIFKLFDSGNDAVLYFSNDSGLLKFNNFNIQEIDSLENGELKFIFDKDIKKFKMNNSSLQLFNQLTVTDEHVLNFIEFDQDGIFKINGDPLWLSIEYEGQLIELKNQPPYTNIIHYKKAHTEFIGKKGSTNPIRKNEGIESYTIGYNKIHEFNNLNFTLSYIIEYNIVHKTVMLISSLMCSETIMGTLVLNYNNKQSKINCTLMKNERTRFEKLITGM